MPDRTGRIVPRRRLAEELKRLRAHDGRSLEQVSQAVMISATKLSCLENAQGNPQPRDIRDLIVEYRVDQSTAARLMQLVGAALGMAWWVDYSFDPKGSTADLDVRIAYESEASAAWVYAIPLFPALLQIDAYGEAMYRSLEPWRSKDDIAQLVQLQSRRRRLLDPCSGRTPLRLVAVCHESTLRQVVGTTAILHQQLKAVGEAFDRPNVDIRILPFTASPSFTSTCMYTYLEFDDALDRDVVHIETHAGSRLLDSDESLAQYRHHFGELLRCALPPKASCDLVWSAILGN